MSAWIVSKTHIDYLVTAAVEKGLIPKEDADKTGRMLWKENLKSVAYRYPNDRDGGRPGPIDFRDHHVDDYIWEETDHLRNNALRQTIACYNYQSCEHDEWSISQSFSLMERLKPAHDSSLQGRLDEENTPWGW